MIGRKKERGLNRLNELLATDPFILDVEEIRKLSDFERVPHYGRILLEYKLPSTFYHLVAKYVEDGEIDENLIGEYVRLDTTNGVSLKLSFDTTSDYLKKYINDNWTTTIKPALVSISGEKRRANSSYFPERDRAAVKDFLNRKSSGMTVAKIAAKHGISESQLRRTAKKMSVTK